MAEIMYVRGDATVPSGEGAKVIAHVCNDTGGWGRGFVLALSRRWREPEAAYRAWHRDRAHNDFGLGAIQLVRVEPRVWVANMVGQRGIRRGGKGVPVRYEAVDTALARLGDEVLRLGASVHMPRIGCGLAGGKWSRMEPLVAGRLAARGIAVTVYDHGEDGA
ncbi:Appr-1-p processing protein [Streptomyces rubradiris]|uniref:Appr-1-p processing protein n=1 Tax=Streptomyces rubradiris TaxID=285531 RepID=A0ABQ3RE44_STRRR|nr:Appr-1-p processing protein [Streptomyces rubradiris]GHH28530.1 Appr-1-p processing protein [Streptomyces rubradiris]GHI54114.1 Appr-1-p processing protein [Streptomyces rubradiris]